MGKYDQHFLMNVEDIKDYLVNQVKLFPSIEDLEVSEVGDGNINYVYKVRDVKTGKKMIVKHADKEVRSSGMKISLDRNKIEYEILNIQHKLAQNIIPDLYHYDEVMSALEMEDISDYKNLRYELIDKKTFPNFAEEISNFLADVLLPTTDLVMDREEKKILVKQFSNPEMCDISENLVLTEPFTNYNNRNNITPGNEDYVTQHLYTNEILLKEIGILRNNYMNNAQALIHGDLHSGSIFINQSGIKIIDPEFAFYGPMGYDIGNVLAHLIFSMVLNEYSDFNEKFNVWIQQTLKDVFDKTFDKISMIYDKKVKETTLYINPLFKEQYLNSIKADTIGYMSTEVIRRVVGMYAVKDLDLIPENSKVTADREMISGCVNLILNRHNIQSGDELLKAFGK